MGLEEKADARTKNLSGGQRRRLDLALALVGDPELVFLDEPTTGFDPAARRTAWNVVRRLKDLGKTVLLTTHYLDEAQALADRVAIVKEGRIVAEGPPDELRPGQRAATASPTCPTAGGSSTRPTTRPICSTASPATRWPAASASRASRSPAHPRGGLPRADARGGCAVSAAALAWEQFRFERKLFWRNPSAAFFNFLLPLLLLVLMATVFGVDDEELDMLIPGIAGMGVMATTFTALAFNMTFLRERRACSSACAARRCPPAPTSAGSWARRRSTRSSRWPARGAIGNSSTASTGRRTGRCWSSSPCSA